MKALLLGAAALSLVAAPAFAQSANRNTTVNLNANVAPMCELSTEGSTTINVNSLTGGSIVDSDGTLNAVVTTKQPISVLLGNNLTAWCNGLASEVTLAANSMYGPADDLSSEFDAFINIALEDWTIDGKAISTVQTANGGAASVVSTTGVFSGPFDGNVRFVDTGNKLVAGNYVGFVSLTIQSK